MKKVLSVAMASAMVLGMGANAFAIQYNTSSSDTAAWPKNFQFDGELFVTDKNGDIVKEASTLLNDQEAVNFQPGDVIWMPLYADDQLSYDAQYKKGTTGEESITSLRLDLSNYNYNQKEVKLLANGDGKWYEVDATGTTYATPVKAYTDEEIAQLNKANGTSIPMNSYAAKANAVANFKGSVQIYAYTGSRYNVANETVKFDGLDRKVQKGSLKLYINGTRYTDVDKFNADVAKSVYTDNDVYATVDLVKNASTDDVVGKPSVDVEKGNRAYGLYTGNIDKNWSINLIEKDGSVSDLIAKAELYKATATDYASYEKYTDQIMPNAVYLKVTLKKEWKTVSNETLKYYVYVANNNNSKKTNQVWVSGKYAPSYRTVDFTWTNNANEASLWKANDNGVAVFDFADKAFFTVKMYKGETMYLDLSTAYDKAIAGDMGVDADSFYKFDNTNANFSRAGELVIVTNDDTLVPYEIDEDGNFVELDADYVTNYAIAHTNQKVNGFRFDTKQLGNYVLSTEELGAEEEPEEPAEEPSEEPAPEVKPDNTGKQNPNTGAEDFVGLAVSLAVVSVAAAGALALKK